MTIADLREFFKLFGTWVGTVGGKQIATELARLVQALEPHDSKTVAEFCDFLLRDGDAAKSTPRKSEKARARSADPERIRGAVESLRSLLNRATEPSLSFESINAEIERLDQELNKEEGLEVAREFGIPGNVTSKIAALQEIGRKIVDRKTVHERAMRLENSGSIES